MFPRTHFAFIPSLAAVFVLVATFLVGVLPVSPVSAASIPPGFPNENNTGLIDRSALEFHDGNLTVTEDGTVIENLEINGRLLIAARNVIVRNVWVYTTDFYTVQVIKGGSLLIEDSEIGHPSYRGERGIAGKNVTARRIDVHDVADGIKTGDNGVYDRIYCHDLASNGIGHHDCFQDDGGGDNWIIKNSTIDARGGNAAVFIKSDKGPIRNVRVENNYLNGGHYTIYSVEGYGGYGDPTGVVITNNRFGRDYDYGVLDRDGDITWSDNTWADTGELIDMKGNVIGEESSTTTTTKAPGTATTSTTSPTSPPSCWSGGIPRTG